MKKILHAIICFFGLHHFEYSQFKDGGSWTDYETPLSQARRCRYCDQEWRKNDMFERY